jgi:hypothetical protein
MIAYVPLLALAIFWGAGKKIKPVT